MYPKQAQSLQAKCQEVENIYEYSLIFTRDACIYDKRSSNSTFM